MYIVPGLGPREQSRPFTINDAYIDVFYIFVEVWVYLGVVLQFSEPFAAHTSYV